MKYVIYCVGQAIGIDEDLNLCNGDLTETQNYSKLILDHIIKVGYSEKGILISVRFS